MYTTRQRDSRDRHRGRSWSRSRIRGNRRRYRTRSRSRSRNRQDDRRQRSPPPPPIICGYFRSEQGCPQGQACRFRHLKLNKPCSLFFVGRCPHQSEGNDDREPQCRFRHEELLEFDICDKHPKRQVCIDFGLGRCTRNPERCRYVHPPSFDPAKRAKFKELLEPHYTEVPPHMRFVPTEATPKGGKDFQHAPVADYKTVLYGKLRLDGATQRHEHCHIVGPINPRKEPKTKSEYVMSCAVLVQDLRLASYFNADDPDAMYTVFVDVCADRFPSVSREKKAAFLEFLSQQCIGIEDKEELRQQMAKGNGHPDAPYSFQFHPQQHKTRLDYVLSCANVANSECHFTIRAFNDSDPTERAQQISSVLSAQFPAQNRIMDFFAFLERQSWAPSWPAASQVQAADLMRTSEIIKCGSAELYPTLEHLFCVIPVRASGEPGQPQTRMQYLRRVSTAAVLQIYNQDFATVDFETEISRVLNAHYRCVVCGKRKRDFASAEPLCQACLTAEIRAEQPASAQILENWLEDMFIEYQGTYDDLHNFDDLRTGYIPPFSCPFFGHCFDRRFLKVGDPINKDLPDSFWEPRRILEWGVTFTYEKRGDFLVRCLEHLVIPDASSTAGWKTELSRLSIRSVHRPQMDLNMRNIQTSLRVQLCACLDDIRPHTKRAIWRRLRTAHATYCNNIVEVFKKVFQALKILHNQRIDQGQQPGGNNRDNGAQNDGQQQAANIHVPAAAPADANQPEDEFASPNFRFHEGMPHSERVNIACRYFVRKRREGNFFQERDEASEAQDDRRWLMSMLLEELREDDLLCRRAVSQDAENRLIYWRKPPGLQQRPPEGTRLAMYEESDKPEFKGVHIFEVKHAHLNVVEQVQRIWHLFGKLKVDDFRGDSKVVGFDDGFRDELDANAEENKRTKINWDVLRAAPEYMLAALTSGVRRQQRFTLRDYVGYMQMRTHGGKKLVKYVFVNDLGFNEDCIRQREERLVEHAQQQRFKDDPGDATSAREVVFRGRTEWD